ncbi:MULTISPECIES: hypothetical protein [Staphylococcus]|uniref:hypothetical protein n=1 Tax=Staphylococcus TaxID=1279 RepID=UPI000E9381FD|nr:MULTISPECIES: hypothetical protein [Staphylococcus]AXV42938.1 hypothetical protein Ssp1_19260 [Staphylococcus sp. M0911]
MKLSKSIGSLVLSAVLLTSISPLASAEEQVQTQNSNVQQSQDNKSNQQTNENKKNVQTYVGGIYLTKKLLRVY